MRGLSFDIAHMLAGSLVLVAFDHRRTRGQAEDLARQVLLVDLGDRAESHRRRAAELAVVHYQHAAPGLATHQPHDVDFTFVVVEQAAFGIMDGGWRPTAAYNALKGMAK